MEIHVVINGLQERCGWDEHSVLELLVEWFTHHAPPQQTRRMIEYLEERADEEDPPESYEDNKEPEVSDEEPPSPF